jgi:hypothetical protein
MEVFSGRSTLLPQDRLYIILPIELTAPEDSTGFEPVSYTR